MSNVGRAASKNWLSLVLIFLFTFSVSLVGARFVRSILVSNSADSKNTATETDQLSPSTTFHAIRLQPAIDSWMATLDGEVGLVIYDLDRDEIAASYNPNKTFFTGDLYQLILAYDGYRRIDNGIEKADSNIGYELNYSDCLNHFINEANPTCTDAFLGNSQRSESLTNFLNSLDLTNTVDFGQASTASDLTKFLKHLWHHDDLSLSSWAILQDAMLNQPEINSDEIEEYQGLPAGFSTARVYSKSSEKNDETGLTYGNLSLIDFVKSGRHFAVVVLSNGVTDLSNFNRLGTLIEGTVLEGQQ